MQALKVGLLLAIFVLAPSLARAEYIIKINFSEKILLLVEAVDSSEVVVKTYPVALPERTPRNLPIKGAVVNIIKNPSWSPTQKTRLAYQKKYGAALPKYLAPGDPRNAMGKAKMIVIFDTPGINPSIRIHGTNQPSSIGQRISRGCIRMLNKDILELNDFLRSQSDSTQFQPITVIFER